MCDRKLGKTIARSVFHTRVAEKRGRAKNIHQAKRVSKTMPNLLQVQISSLPIRREPFMAEH